MTEKNQKEMLAGLFLSKFDQAGLTRLGYPTFNAAYEDLAGLIDGNPRSVKAYRDEFDPVFPNPRRGWADRGMHPSRKAMLDRYGNMDMESMAELLEEQFRGTARYLGELDRAMQSSSSGAEVASKAEAVRIEDAEHFAAGVADPASSEGRERIALTRVRVSQAKFRKWILDFYGGRCCITGLAVPEVLQACHILDWSVRPETRMNPSNGLCLSATYHAAFDNHLIEIDQDYRVVLSRSLRDFCTDRVHKDYFLSVEGRQILLPSRFPPDQRFLAEHREKLVV